MGYAMAERLAKAGADLTVWNRTRAKAEPLAAVGAKVAGSLVDLAACDIVFVMVSTWDDVKQVVQRPGGLLSGSRAPEHGGRVLVDLARGLGRAARAAGGARRADAGGAGLGQRQGRSRPGGCPSSAPGRAPRSTRRCRR